MLQEQHDENRKAYMENQMSHQEFYVWLADSIGITTNDLPVSLDRVKKSTDPHLNDIPLHLWDQRDPLVRGKAVRAGMRSWSLSDTVCVLKNFARRAVTQADPPYPWCHGNPTINDCIEAGYCRRNPNCGE